MPRNLTPKQAAILEFIRAYSHEHGYAPTLQEIADSRGTTVPTAHEHLKQLERKGYLYRNRYDHRGLVAIPPMEDGVEDLLRVVIELSVWRDLFLDGLSADERRRHCKEVRERRDETLARLMKMRTGKGHG